MALNLPSLETSWESEKTETTLQSQPKMMGLRCDKRKGLRNWKVSVFWGFEGCLVVVVVEEEEELWILVKEIGGCLFGFAKKRGVSFRG